MEDSKYSSYLRSIQLEFLEETQDVLKVSVLFPLLFLEIGLWGGRIRWTKIFQSFHDPIIMDSWRREMRRSGRTSVSTSKGKYSDQVRSLSQRTRGIKLIAYF